MEIDLPKNKIPVTVSISLQLLPIIDSLAQKENLSRSSFIVQAVEEKIKKIEEK